MKNRNIKVSLEYYPSAQTYVITRLQGAVIVLTDCDTVPHHVGATLIEKEAESLARRYDVSVIEHKATR